jgi:hypothetical protein
LDHGHDTPGRLTRYLVRNSPLKQKLVLLLDSLGLDKQSSVDDFPQQGCTPEQVKDTRQTPKETIKSVSVESSAVAAPPIDSIADEEEISDDKE